MVCQKRKGKQDTAALSISALGLMRNRLKNVAAIGSPTPERANDALSHENVKRPCTRPSAGHRVHEALAFAEALPPIMLIMHAKEVVITIMSQRCNLSVAIVSPYPRPRHEHIACTVAPAHAAFV